MGPSPIFVLGNQKTGTTAIAALLAALTDVSVTLDIIQGMKEPVETKLHTKGLSFSEFITQNLEAFSSGIVKEPRLTFLYEELLSSFPGSKCIFVNRDPRDNIRSILDRLSLPGNLAQVNEEQLGAVNPEWRLVLDGRWLGLQGENYVEMLAARWNLAADVYLRNAHNLVLIRYEDFVKDKAGALAHLARQVGLVPSSDISDLVDIQYQPRGKRNVSWLDFFGTDNLSRIERICSGRMKRFSYTPVNGLVCSGD